MGQYSSYYLYQKYEKRGSQDWIPCYPNTFSISGDSTNPMPYSAKSECDPQCGYTPKGSDDYDYEKWEVSDGYICDDTTKYARERKYVSDDNVNWIATDIYRRSTTVLAYNSTDCGYDPQWDNYNCSKWEVVSNDYICNECNKYQKLRKYVRQCENCDSCSSSWSATNIYKQGDIIEYDSTDCGYVIGERMYRWVNLNPSSDYYCEDCGYVPPTPTASTKFYATYSGGQSYSAACDSSSAVTTADTKPSGYEYTAMTTAQIGDCVTSIGNDAFFGCRSLTSIDIPSNVTSIGDYAFYSCSGLTSVNIPSSVTSISEGVLARCTGLTSVNIPSGVTSIGEWAFNSCTSLQGITVNATTPPTLVNTNALDYTNNCSIYVPSASVNTYKSASGWSTYSSRIQAIT